VRTRLLAAALAALLLGCGDSAAPEGVIDREVFIATWVDLREIARTTGDPIPEAERTRVLGENGVTEDQLLGFVAAYGDDPRYMAEVWTEIEARQRPPAPDSTAASDSTPQL
jgi:type IV pilus biogenesis protein CpaD/CtpE